MKSENDDRQVLDQIESQMHRMLNGECSPYDAGSEIWGLAFGGTFDCKTIPSVMHPMWLIWGALTDWVELRPEETTQAESEMLRAAKEWLALPPNDPDARSSYLDRWVYEEMGYAREGKSPPEKEC